MTPDRDEALLRRALQEGLHPAETDLWPAVAEALPAREERYRRRTRAQPSSSQGFRQKMRMSLA